jgi:hypothetical protein
MWSALEQNFTDHLIAPYIPYAVWAGMDDKSMYKHNMQTSCSSYQPLMMGTHTAHEMSDAKSTLTCLIAQEYFVVFCLVP